MRPWRQSHLAERRPLHALRNQLGQKSLRRFALAYSSESKSNALAQTKVPTTDGRETEALRLLRGAAEWPIRTTVVDAAEVTFGAVIFPRSVGGETSQPQRCLQSMFGTFFVGGRYWPNHLHPMIGGPSGLRPRMDRLSLLARPGLRGGMDHLRIAGIRLAFVGAWSAIAFELGPYHCPYTALTSAVWLRAELTPSRSQSEG
jgi:hypothetical protein